MPASSSTTRRCGPGVIEWRPIHCGRQARRASIRRPEVQRGNAILREDCPRRGCCRRVPPRCERRWPGRVRSEEHTSELQSHLNLVCRLLLEKKKNKTTLSMHTYLAIVIHIH